jgi:FtsP/CotA-like multicopper oxidase with cupredoxin domain
MSVRIRCKIACGLLAAALAGVGTNAGAVVFVQCPDDTDGDGLPPRDIFGNDIDDADDVDDPNVQCMHLTGGDGWVSMAEADPSFGSGRREIYIFGFSDVTDVPPEEVLSTGIFRANASAPTIRLREGDELYLTLSNVGTHQRPDLFDPHSVHYHGFPNASAIFDGLPESAIAINQQASFTYYYNNVEPGTYMWHCHVEATEHMQMGMLGNLYVEPLQNQTGCPAAACPVAELEGGPGSAPLGYVYNDKDGSTGYDVEYAIQLQAYDHEFHDASRDIQPLPFAAMRDTYPTLNGRGYPDTAVLAAPPAPPDSSATPPQPRSSLITAKVGQKVLLRLSNLGIVQHYTISVLGIPMKVVGRGARLLRGAGQAAPANVFYQTNVVNLGGGESTDVILETAGIAPGTYFLYATNLNYLSNFEEDAGGYMTEIVVTP